MVPFSTVVDLINSKLETTELDLRNRLSKAPHVDADAPFAVRKRAAAELDAKRWAERAFRRVPQSLTFDQFTILLLYLDQL
jgi:hypothetical protein